DRRCDMTRPLTFSIFVLISTTLMAQTTHPSWQKTPQGQLILRPFANAPYPHPSRANGFKYKSTTYPADPHYVDSTVGIFIPDGYEPGDTVDYVVHFHGWGNHVSNVLVKYKLMQQLRETKVNAILI